MEEMGHYGWGQDLVSLTIGSLFPSAMSPFLHSGFCDVRSISSLPKSLCSPDILPHYIPKAMEP